MQISWNHVHDQHGKCSSLTKVYCILKSLLFSFFKKLGWAVAETERNTERESIYVCHGMHVLCTMYSSALRLPQPPPHPALGVRACRYTLYVRLKWILGIWTCVFAFGQQVLCTLSPLLQLSGSLLKCVTFDTFWLFPSYEECSFSRIVFKWNQIDCILFKSDFFLHNYFIIHPCHFKY